jgi:hypothetical protein
MSGLEAHPLEGRLELVLRVELLSGDALAPAL